MATTYLTTPEIHPARNSSAGVEFERSFFANAATIGRDIVCCADSNGTETGQGGEFCKSFALALHQAFGNVRGTGWCACGTSRQPTLFIRCQAYGSAAAASGITTSYFPPSFTAPHKVTNTAYLSFCLQPDAIDNPFINSLSWPRPGVNVIDPAAGDSWVAEVLVCTRGTGTTEAGADGTLTWDIRKNTSNTPAAVADGTSVASGSWTDLALDTETPGAFVLRTDAFTLDAANPYTSLVLFGASSAGVIIVAARFINVSRPQGATCTWIAAGGYTAWSTNSIHNLHANSGTVIEAMGFTAGASFYGVNDGYVGAGISAATWETNIGDHIDEMRGWIGQTVPWVIFSTQWRTEDSTGERDQYDQYPGAAYNVASSKARVRAINSRKRLHQMGWNVNNENISAITIAGEWTATTAYTAGQYVTRTGAEIRYFLCLSNHTAASTDAPGTGTATNWPIYWREVGRFLLKENPAVHYTPVGAWIKAQVEVGLLVQASYEFLSTNVQRGPRGEIV